MAAPQTHIMTGVALVAVIAAVSYGGSTSETHQGIYTWGPEIHTFHPCGSEKQYWVRTTQELTDQLSAAHEEGRTQPYQGLYATVAGYVSGPSSEEQDGAIGAQYEETFTITSVSLTERAPPADCGIAGG
jgi:hypothetical protein